MVTEEDDGHDEAEVSKVKKKGWGGFCLLYVKYENAQQDCSIMLYFMYSIIRQNDR